MAPPSAPRPSHGGRRALCSSLAQQQAARRPGHDSSSTSAPASDHGIQVPCVFFLGSGPFHSAPWTQVFILPMVGSPYEGRRAGCQHPSPSSAPFSHGAAANLHGRPLFFFLAQLLGAPARPAAIAFKFSAQQCRFKKTATLDPLCTACSARSAQSRSAPSRWCLRQPHVASPICAALASRRQKSLVSPSLVFHCFWISSA
jgi:hypothetical protein